LTKTQNKTQKLIQKSMISKNMTLNLNVKITLLKVWNMQNTHWVYLLKC